MNITKYTVQNTQRTNKNEEEDYYVKAQLILLYLLET